ncbi:MULTISPECIES: STAS domain-containing protein [unclassified Picosynechococcus]|uniref:STAS domain-containing protein n=1 Tax=unclassified Picosynechococcus TaxID=3079910 RepID=UPI0004AA113E|nr:MULTISPECIES: STAS domain-containing protein [unclassified Picosynechococcus]AMA09735.1 sulfate transporter [Picosynechococcus sp. PCC 73109]QCS50601.1 STAS domain-containing protein [Picosynechococcus sp. PCC 11901]
MSKEFVILEPQGILDGPNTNELRLQIIDLLRGEIDGILLDLNQIEFMNSSSIGALVAILKVVRAENKKLYLCSLTDQVSMIFELTKMDRIFTTFKDRDEFNRKVIEASEA